MWVNPEMNQSDAFVAAWLPGSEGTGVADVLVGDAQGEPRFDFSGKLSFSWPRLPLQAKLNPHHHGYNPLFPLGYGLSYSEPSLHMEVLEEDVEGVRKSDGGDITLYRGRPLAPWAVFVEGDRSEASILSGPYAKHVTGQIEVQTTDMEVQEDALKINFNGGGAAGVFIGGSEMNLSEFHNEGTLQFQLRMEKPLEGDLALSVNNRSINLMSRLEEVAGKGWQTVSVPVSCFADDESELQKVTQPFRLGASDAIQLSIGKIQFLRGSTETVQCN
jgi:beta-glucosidase